MVVIFLSFLFASACLAQVPQLFIVQVQIAGEKTDNDFIKIYNPSGANLDISGYKLRKRSSTGGESSIRVFPEGSVISAKNYFIWANSKEGYADSINANERSTATLAKNNSVAILTPTGEIIDALAWGENQNPFAEGQPFIENPIANQKLERKKTNETYQDTNNNSEDFYLNPLSQPTPPQQETQSEPEAPSAETSPITETLPTTETSPTPPLPTNPSSSVSASSPEVKKTATNYPSGIVLNEILPSPEGSDEEEEWIEIFNQNGFEVDLSGWKIKDSSGAVSVFTFPQGTKISDSSFLVFSRPTTKIVLNNDADGISLLKPDGSITETISYQKAKTGQSWARTDSGWFWTENLTPGAKNIISEPVAKNKETELSENVSMQDNQSSQKELASVGGQITKKDYFIIFIALGAAILSAVIIFLLKRNLKTS